jgi:alpha-galactosidase
MRTFCLLFVAAGLQAADLTGTWLATRTMPDRPPQETVYRFKQDGNRLTGTIESQMGLQAIENGKVEGDSFEFQIVMGMPGMERRVTQKGKIAGETIEIQMSGPMGPPPGMGPGAPGAQTEPRASASGPGGPPRGGMGPGGPRQMGPTVARRLSPQEAKARDGAAAARPKPVLLEVLKELPYNGLAKTPPMGWNSWNAFRTRIDDQTIRSIADAMVSSGMKRAGYEYINIDDGWQGRRDEKGVLQPNERFPDMKALADYVHSRGLKLGIYSSPGSRTCAGYEGSYGYEQLDARTWAAWGFDYLKYDWCSAGRVFEESKMRPVYQLMGEALRATGRPIVYSLCQYGRQNVQEWGPKVGGNSWRTTGDIRDQWDSMVQIGFSQNGLEKFAAPGHWNDPDMLEVGNTGMTPAEYRAHFSLWAILASPLLAGNDLRKMSDETKEILTNPEVIAVSQDPLGRQGYRIRQEEGVEVWARPLEEGAWAVGLFNTGKEPRKIAVRWQELKLASKLKVRDLWAKRNVGTLQDSFETEVPSHSVVLLRIAR